jgi:hypothetical protein
MRKPPCETLSSAAKCSIAFCCIQQQKEMEHLHTVCVPRARSCIHVLVRACVRVSGAAADDSM